MSTEQRLAQLGLVLPPCSAPAGSYAAALRSGSLLFLSGKAPSPVDGVLPRGKLGREFSAEQGYAFARSAALELIAALRAELGSLDEVAQFVELQGSLNTVPEFEAHAEVLDGARICCWRCSAQPAVAMCARWWACVPCARRALDAQGHGGATPKRGQQDLTLQTAPGRCNRANSGGFSHVLGGPRLALAGTLSGPVR